MLEAKINEKEIAINVNGNLETIMTDFTILLRQIYNGLNDDIKEMFESHLKEIVKTRLYAIDEKQINEMAKKAREDVIEKIKNKEDFFKSLNGKDKDEFIAFLKDILK